jgi:hypothetical protein
MTAETISLRLIGDRPLLMHAGHLADPLNPIATNLQKITRKRDKTQADHEEISRLEWFGGLWLTGDHPCIPGEALEAAFISAARTQKKGKQAAAGLLVESDALLVYDGPDDIHVLWENLNFRYRTGVRINNSRTMRTRAQFPTWSVEFTATFLPTLLNRSEVIEIFRIAGFRIGLGDWRPKFGKFKVDQLE